MVNVHRIFLQTKTQISYIILKLILPVVEVIFCFNSHVQSKANVIVGAEMASDQKTRGGFRR